MQQDIVGQVLGVTGRPTRNGRTIYDIAFSDGNKYTSFDGEIAQKAQSLVGQNVSARTEVGPSRDGRFTNYNILDVAPQGQLAPSAMPVAGGTQIAMQAASNGPVAGIPMQQQGDPQKDARISKAVAVKSAVPIVAALFQGAGPETLQEALDTLETAAKGIYVLLTGPPTVADAIHDAAVAVENATPEAVAKAVNQAAGTPVVQPGAALPW